MNVLYEQSVLSTEFIVGWHKGDIKSDKHCSLYDRKTEKAFRLLLDKFVEWLQSAGGEEDYGEEEEEGAAEEETKEEVNAEEETEQQRMQRMIAEQKRAQEEALRKAKEKAEQQ